MSNHLSGVWSTLKPGIITVPVSEETGEIIRRAFFAGAAAALSLHGNIQADAQRLTRLSLVTLENEIAFELKLPNEGDK